MFYMDIYYFILVVPVLILALAAQIMVKSSYKKYSKVLSLRGLTGAQAATMVLRYYGITDVTIEGVMGELSDHYDPKAKVIRLSAGVANSSSIASIGIACHEAGHAAQHAQEYAPIRIRNAILPVCNIGSFIGIPIALIGLFLHATPLIYVGLALYGMVALFQIVTLPVELDASHRAIKVIEETNLLTVEEVPGAKKVLVCAAMTYITALLSTLANLLRLLLLFTGGKRR